MEILQQLNDPRAQRHLRRPRQARAHDAELEGVPAAPRLRVRRRRQRPHRDPRRLRDLLRPALPEPDAVLALAERARDLLDPAQPDQLRGRRRASSPSFRYGVDPLPAPPPPDYSILPAGRVRPHQRPGRRGAVRAEVLARVPEGASAPTGRSRATSSTPSACTSRASRTSTRASRASATRPTRARRPARSRCQRGVNSRYFDRGVRGGRPAGQPPRADQHVHHHQRSLFDSWTTTVTRPPRAEHGLAQLRAGQLEARGAASPPRRTAATASPSTPEPVQRGGVRADAARRAPSLRGQRASSSCPGTSRSRRSSSWRAPGRTR